MRAKRRRPLQWWNFWTVLLCTGYEFRAWHPDDMGLPAGQRRLIRAYGGRTWQQPWTKRIEEHMWGKHYGNKVKPWRDTVPGWRLDGTVQEIIQAGGVRVMWQFRTVPIIAVWTEWCYSIKWRRPRYNQVGNEGNRKRITPELARAQADLRAGRVPEEPVAWRRPVLPGWVVWGLPTVGFTVLCLPGMPAAGLPVGVVDVVGWSVTHWRSLVLLVLLGMVALVLSGPSGRGRAPKRSRVGR